MFEIPAGVVLVCDGGSLGNQDENRRGYGSIMAFVDGKHRPMNYTNAEGLAQTSEHVYIDYGVGVTNNVAELKTMIVALGYIREVRARAGKSFPVTICSDSEMAVCFANGTRQARKPHLKPLRKEIRDAIDELGDIQVQWVPNDDVKMILGH